MSRALAIVCTLLAVSVSRGDVDFARDIKPIFKARCVSCHGAVRQKAGLRLDAGQLVLKGAKGGPIVVAGKPGDSSLLDAVLGKDRDRMPPEKEGEPLSAQQIKLLRDWIAQGAKAPTEPIPEDPKSHWAYQPIASPPAPTTHANPIDGWLAVERAKKKTPVNPLADKATLLRRVYLDLIGLPPTRDELLAFVNDPAPDAYEKVVDRLLASPAHGERWGRHWMDVWRYSDPFGLGEEYRYSQRHIWRWRDWIVDSLNADKGYDRMIVEMLAGDEVAPADKDTLRATGFLARNWYKFNRNVWIQDTVEYTAAGFLGVTMKCARCHDHKYDPISQEDYYRLRAFFEPHDVRIDTFADQPDPVKDGLARAFDAKADAPTYFFHRGDERNADKSKVMQPNVPGVLGEAPKIAAIKFSPKDSLAALPEAEAGAKKLARADLDKAEKEFQRATTAIADARKLVDDLAKGVKPKATGPTPVFADDFAKRSDVWKVQSGEWKWEAGKLRNEKPGSFLTVAASLATPADFVARVRYVTTGGTLGSVGVSYDVHGKSFQGIYINASAGSAVRAFHRVNGADTYPQAGIVPHPLAMKEEVTLDFAVRGDMLNTWVNGQLRNVYRLPMARKPGGFTLWAHEAVVEFREVKLAPLPAHVSLAMKSSDKAVSPWGGASVPTLESAKAAQRLAEGAVDKAQQAKEIALANMRTIESRVAADRAKLGDSKDRVELAKKASQLERHLAVLKADEAWAKAKSELDAFPPKPSDDKAKKAFAAAEQKVAAAKKSVDAAREAEKKESEAYTPLVKLSPETSTGRRLALANWIVDRKNPLTARVAINHIWMRHFGTPLVGSVANFGLSGKKPTHPELLDWLARDLMQSGWKMKRLHRLIVTSEAYRLSSATNPTAAKIDPDNRMYWRMNVKRMEAEAVRDSLLAATGRLDRTMGGPIIAESKGQTTLRRSIYFRFNTEYKMLFLDQFDVASPSECFQRTESVVPQQALALSNSALAIGSTRKLADLLSKTSPEEAAFVTSAFEQVLNRLPTEQEKTRCQQFLAEQADVFRTSKLTPFPPSGDAVQPPASDPMQRAREDLVLVLFNHNDFVTIR